MPIKAQSADGMTHEFPDGTSDAVVDRVMQSYAKQQGGASVDTGTLPIASREERERGLAHPPHEETMTERFRRGFSEGFGEGAPLGGGPLEIVTQPARAALAGVRGLTRGVQEVLPRDIAAMPEAFAGSATGLMGHVGVPGAASEALFPGAASATTRTPQTRAADIVSRAFKKSVKGGQTTALDALDTISEARQSGQPLTIADIGGRPVQRLAGSVFRAGGEAGAHMEKFYKERGTQLTAESTNTVAGQRIEKAINENIATGSYKQATANLISERATRAKPLWDEAMAGGSLAPLEKQFETVFKEAGQAEQAALRGLNEARATATQSAARQSTAGNVYASSGANRAAREADAKVKSADFALSEARKQSDLARSRLRQAQDDGTINAPGAVWSQRLQQFLDLPDWQKGIRRGFAQERRDAVTDNRPFNPSEYAIVGTDEKGGPLVGAVPTTKLLQVAREGIEKQIDQMRDPLTGGLTKAGRSLWRNLKEFEGEAYRLNPAWKEANDQWRGDSASIRSLQLGKKIFNLPIEDLTQDFGAMTEGDRDLFRLAAASKAVEDVRKTPFAADPSKRVLNNPDELMRLSLLFDDREKFGKFVQFIDRERTMFETPGKIMGGSQTVERAVSDAQTLFDVVHGIARVAHGNLLSAWAPMSRALSGMGMFKNPQLDLEVSKVLTDPAIPLSADRSGRLGLGSDAAMRAINSLPR